MEKEEVAKYYADVYQMSEHNKMHVFIKFLLCSAVYPKESYNTLIPRIIDEVLEEK